MSEATTRDEMRWKDRVEEPTNRFIYYPLSRPIVRLLTATRITPNQVTLIQPFIALAAGYLIAMGDRWSLVLGALAFELRSLLDCVDGGLARAKKMSSPGGHALDALCDWLGVVFLYIGILVHFWRFSPPSGAWSAYLSVTAVVCIAGAQGALRSAGADYYMRKFNSILGEGRDATVEHLRTLVTTARRPLERAEAAIGTAQHLMFEQSRFCPDRTPALDDDQVQALREAKDGPGMRTIAFLWSISNGDAFIRITVLSLLFGPHVMWELQLFWATGGVLWIMAVVVLSSWYLRRTFDAAAAPVEA